MTEPLVYDTHDNGGRPYRVEVSEKTYRSNFGDTLTVYDVEIFQILYDDEGDIEALDDIEEVPRFTCSRVFVGISPRNQMTEFSGGWGPEFDGNSMLFLIDINTYLFVGQSIRRFMTDSPILVFVSPVGNNDVPYPFARTERGDALCFAEDSILRNYDWPADITQAEPYRTLYDMPRAGADAERIRFTVLHNSNNF